jgi:drug/metabolite transporter (DMT)-like permease
MKSTTFRSDLLLLLAATIWGLAFVAQRVGMDHVGPFTFNGIRFALGGLSLLPFVWMSRKRINAGTNSDLIRSGIVSGICLFAGISFQQVGIVYTTAGKAGFITGLYVVLVPILGLFLGTAGPGGWTSVSGTCWCFFPPSVSPVTSSSSSGSAPGSVLRPCPWSSALSAPD